MGGGRGTTFRMTLGGFITTFCVKYAVASVRYLPYMFCVVFLPFSKFLMSSYSKMLQSPFPQCLREGYSFQLITRYLPHVYAIVFGPILS